MSLTAPFGHRLRHWRHQRGVSQLELAHKAATTPRHVSFLETGRSRPGEAMVLRLADALDVPLRGRNELLRSAGLPPLYAERALDDDQLHPYHAVIQRVLAQQEPFPAFVLDRRWDVVDANRGARWLLPPGPFPVDGLAWLVEDGPMRDALRNPEEILWSAHHLLSQELALGDDAAIRAKIEGIERVLAGAPQPLGPPDRPVLCPVLDWGGQTLRTFTTVMRFGHARDVTLDELRVELVFPEDAETEAVMRALGAAAH